MIVYYEDPSVQVTSDAVRVDEQVLWFPRITEVWYTRSQKSWRELAGRGFWGMAYLMPFVGALAGFVIAFAFDMSIPARVLVIVVSIMVGLSAGPLIDPILGKMDDSFDRGLYRYEIWVEYDGVQVRVLETWDAARFGRIYRALCRAAGA